MTEAEKYVKAIEFQRLYVAVDTGFDASKNEEDKIKLVAGKLGITEDEGKKLADFIKDKAGGLTNENALIQAREDYWKNLNQEESDAKTQLKDNIDNQVVEKAEQEALKAGKVAKVAKRKSRINIVFKLVLLGLVIGALAGGSLAIISPIINAVALLLGGLSGATLMGLGCGVWLYSDKIKKWWENKDKKRGQGKDRYLGNYFQEEDEKAQKELSKKIAEWNSEKGKRTALQTTFNDRQQKRQDADNEFNNHPANKNAKNAVDNLIQRMTAEWQNVQTADPGWANSYGKDWLKYGIARLKKQLAMGNITDSNYVTDLQPYEDFFIGSGGIFDPASAIRADFDAANRVLSPGTDHGKDKAPNDPDFYELT